MKSDSLGPGSTVYQKPALKREGVVHWNKDVKSHLKNVGKIMQVFVQWNDMDKPEWVDLSMISLTKEPPQPKSTSR